MHILSLAFLKLNHFFFSSTYFRMSLQILYKTLNPKWNQTLEFPDDGSLLELHVKDHNALLPTSSIGDCVVEYQLLPPNQMADKWIPLQGVKRGEIHIQITRRIPELEKKSNSDSKLSPAKMHHLISDQVTTITISFALFSMDFEKPKASLKTKKLLLDLFG